MLAIKLHKKKKLILRQYSFLIPVLTWETGRVNVKRWVWMLDYRNRGNPNDRVRFVSLVRVPKRHRVFLADDWCVRLESEVTYTPLDEISRSDKERVISLDFLPEMILGEALPGSAIKWTKDIRLLYRSGAK